LNKHNFLFAAFVTSLFLVAPSLYSQGLELDDAYLKSLPEGVRTDVLTRMDQKKQSEEIVYRRPSTMVKKPFSEVSKNERFGASIFNMMQSSFMPINEPNFDGSYVLDFGDILELQLVGQKNSIDRLSIKRDGSINIAEIGKINLSGLSMDSAFLLIQNKVKSSFIGTEAFITLVNVRDIQVLIAGNAFNPGIYTLNGNSNALHALSMSGGMDAQGSYREINIIREGITIDTLDLYDIFIDGKPRYGPRLKSGDSIFIKPVQNIISVVGGVNRPGLYELKEGETFKNLIRFANNFKYSADLDFLSYERLNKTSIDFFKISEEDLSSIKPLSGDTLFIGEFLYGEVFISGAVVRPGRYSINDGDTLSQIVLRAGGYMPSAYPFGGYLQNNATKNINILANEKLYNRFIEDIINKQSESTSGSMALIMEQVKNAPVSGRVMAEFDLDYIEVNPLSDTILEDQDVINIPHNTQQVYVYGEVNNKGTIRYSPNKKISYYIQNAGGTSSAADMKNIFIIHPNGKTQLMSSSSKLSFLESGKQISVYPGSIIFIPRESSIKDPAKVASIWAPILSSLALSLTSLSILSDR